MSNLKIKIDPITWVELPTLVQDLAPLEAQVDQLFGPATIVFQDDFSNHTNGSISGKVPVIGPAWGASGTAPTISSGKLTGVGGYAYANLGTHAHYIEVVMVFNGTGGANTISWVTDPFALTNLIHLEYDNDGFTLKTLQSGVWATHDTMAGQWKTTCKTDGATPYKIGIVVMGNTALVIGPNGEPFSVVDVRLGALESLTNGFYLQPTADGSINSVRAIRFPVDDTAAALLSPIDIAGLALVYGLNGNLSSKLNAWHEVSMGIGQAGLPALIFGPHTVITKLTAAASAGASAFTSEVSVYGATTVVVGQGSSQEAVTLSGAPTPLPIFAGPYAQGISGTLANAHATGEVVTATGFTRPRFDWNPFSGVIDVAGAPLNLIEALHVDGVKVVGNQQAANPDTSGATLGQLETEVNELKAAMRAHGLIA